MAIAGRVAIVPKGEWSQSVTYDKLDLVTHNGNTFIAYKSSVGVEPVDGDNWMLVMQGIDPQDIENIIDGTTPVGDSNKLGGKSAEAYALGTDLANYLPNTGGTVDDGVTDFPLNIKGVSGAYAQYSNANNEVMGYIGFGMKNVPTFVYSDKSVGYHFLHTGNKPTGTYTGNGDATKRTIATGGIGDIAIVRGNGYITYMIAGLGAHSVRCDTGIVVGLGTSVYSTNDGKIIIASDSEAVNKSGVVYTYYRL